MKTKITLFLILFFASFGLVAQTLQFSVDSVSVDAQQVTKEVIVTSNVNWYVENDYACDWLNVIKNEESGSLILNFSANTTTSRRTFMLTVASDATKETIGWLWIAQAAGDGTPMITFMHESLTFDSRVGDVCVTASSNVTWDVYEPAEDWIEASKSSDGELCVTVIENQFPNSRICALNIYDVATNQPLATYRVSQEAKANVEQPYFRFSADSVSVEAYQVTEEVIVTSNVNWYVENDYACDWLNVIKNEESGSLILNFSANTTTSRRTFMLTVASDATKETIGWLWLAQAAGEGEPQSPIYPTSLSFTSDADFKYAFITSGLEWYETVDSPGNWLFTEKVDSATLKVSVIANPDTQSRTANITINTAASQLGILRVTQDGNNNQEVIFQLSESDISVDAQQVTKEIMVTSNVTWQPENGQCNWITAINNEESGSLILMINENTTEYARSCNLLFTNSQTKKTIGSLYVTQAAGEGDPQSPIYPTSLSFTSDADFKYAFITSSLEWYETVDSPDNWLFTEKVDSATLKVSVIANPDTQSRTANITINTAASQLGILKVTQDGKSGGITDGIWLRGQMNNWADQSGSGEWQLLPNEYGIYKLTTTALSGMQNWKGQNTENQYTSSSPAMEGARVIENCILGTPYSFYSTGLGGKFMDIICSASDFYLQVDGRFVKMENERNQLSASIATDGTTQILIGDYDEWGGFMTIASGVSKIQGTTKVTFDFESFALNFEQANDSVLVEIPALVGLFTSTSSWVPAEITSDNIFTRVNENSWQLTTTASGYTGEGQGFKILFGADPYSWNDELFISTLNGLALGNGNNIEPLTFPSAGDRIQLTLNRTSEGSFSLHYEHFPVETPISIRPEQLDFEWAADSKYVSVSYGGKWYPSVENENNWISVQKTDSATIEVSVLENTVAQARTGSVDIYSEATKKFLASLPVTQAGREIVFGCMDTDALNYNPQANVHDSTTCVYPVYGCTNPQAINYDRTATKDDGSCTFAQDTTIVYGCTDPSASNYNQYASHYDYSCVYDSTFVFGCMDSKATNFTELATIDDGSCVYEHVVPGCTDSVAQNYNTSATTNDGSCKYETVIWGCRDIKALNYNSAATKDNGYCEYAQEIKGCTDRSAENYVYFATINDGSCIYAQPEVAVVYGCTDNHALNYNPYATDNNNTCIYQHIREEISGCIDETAINYNPVATVSADVCIYNNTVLDIYGCTDSKALNYNASANVDDKSCVYARPINSYVPETEENPTGTVGTKPVSSCGLDASLPIDNVEIVSVELIEDYIVKVSWLVYQNGVEIPFEQEYNVSQAGSTMFFLSIICKSAESKNSLLRAALSEPGIVGFTVASQYDVKNIAVTTQLEDADSDVLNKIDVYPNPFNETLNIALNDGEMPKFIGLYSVEGQLQSICMNTVQIQINTTELPEGLYFLKVVFDNNRMETIKLIKK